MSEKFNKLFFKTVYDLRVYKVTLPEGIMLKHLSFVPEEYWLSDNIQDRAFYAAPNKSNRVPNCLMDDGAKIKGIRPIVHFVSSEVKEGDELFINNYLFTVFEMDGNKGKALCKTIVDFAPYFDLSSKRRKPYYEKILQRFNNVEHAFKVHKATNFECKNFELALLENSVAVHLASTLLDTNYNYWLQGRRNEFEGYWVTTTGLRKSSNIMEKKYLCPLLTLKNEDTFKLFPHNLIEYHGKVFRVISNTENVTAICLNPIGISCYSTGIDAIKDNDDKEFYLNSDAHEAIERWRLSF